MEITNLHSFLETFFQAHQCDIIKNDKGILTIQLTEEIDKALMNRPFYWHYMKNTGRIGEPMKLTLITNRDKKDDGEWIHFGSPRLQQIMNYLKQTTKFLKLFQKVDTLHNTPLYPWLLTNFKISYEGKQKKEEMFSIGLNLVNGKMKVDMMEIINKLHLQMTISDYCYPISPLIKLKSGFARIEKVIDHYISDQDHEWAQASITTLKEEIQMIEHFYNQTTEKKQLNKEKDEITERYTPSITYNVVSGGILYLTENINSLTNEM